MVAAFKKKKKKGRKKKEPLQTANRFSVTLPTLEEYQEEWLCEQSEFQRRCLIEKNRFKHIGQTAESLRFMVCLNFSPHGQETVAEE